MMAFGRHVFFLALPVILFPCIGCGDAVLTTPDDCTLRIAGRTDIQSLDPALVYDYFVFPLVRMIYQGLLDYDDHLHLVPWLTEEMPSLADGGRTYTFRLRRGVRFSNGRELTADDFVFTLERVLDPATKSPGEGYFRNIMGATAFQKAREREAEAIRSGARQPGSRWIDPVQVAGLRASDRYTLQIRLEQPDPAFLNLLAMPFAYAVPEEAVAAAGLEFYRRPVGTGPFVLKDWRRGVRLRFERNPLYSLREQPLLDAVELVIGPDDVTQQMMFERGELDMLLVIAASDFVRLRSDERWRPYLSALPMNATYYIALNCEMEPFTDARVRQAMNYAIDKERLLRIMNGRGIVAHGVLPPLMPGYNKDLAGYPHDPARAKQLLAEAGYSNGFAVPIWVAAEYAEGVRLMEAVQQNLAEVGVRLELKTVNSGVWNEAVGQRKATACSFTNWFQNYPDPSDVFGLCLDGERITEVHCNNTSFYSNPQVNTLLKKAARESDPARRLELYRQAEAIVVRDAPWVFLYHPIDSRLCQPRVQGYTMHPVWPVRYERLGKETR